MMPVKSVPVGTGSLDLYPAARNSAPAPWVSANQLWDLVHGDAPGFTEFLKAWGRGTGPHLVREISDTGTPLLLIAPTAAWDIINQAPVDLEPATRAALAEVFAPLS